MSAGMLPSHGRHMALMLPDDRAKFALTLP